MEKILVNDVPLDITTNLQAALLEFRNLIRDLDSTTEIPYLWVDSICLDQSNEREKLMEIPRMGLIFGQCERVLAWLGPVGSDEDEAVSEMSAKIKHFDSLAESSGMTVYQQIQAYQESKERSSIAERVRLRATLNDISDRDWFKRVWIIQETTLAAQDPVMLLGPHTFSFGTYFALQLLLNSGDTTCLGTVSRSDTLCHAIMRISYHLPLTATGEGAESGSPRQRSAFDMLEFMFYTAKLKASVPHDYIYGLVGLMRHGIIPYELQPRYNESVEITYYIFTRYILSQTSHLGVLSLGQVGVLAGVPSWVPDLKNRNPDVGEYEPQSVDMVLIEWSILSVPGIILGRCISAFPAQKPEDFAVDPPSTFVQCDEAIFAVASRVKRVPPSQIFEEWLNSRLSRAAQNLPIPSGQDLSNSIRGLVRLYERLVHGEAIDAGELSSAEQTSLSSAEQLLQQPAFLTWMFSSQLFVLQDGSTGSLPSSAIKAERGDKLCVFPSLNQPLMIRSVGSNQQVEVHTAATWPLRWGDEDIHGSYSVSDAALLGSQGFTGPEFDCKAKQHRILGHAVVDSRDRYDEYRDSFLQSSTGRETRHKVDRVYLV